MAQSPEANSRSTVGSPEKAPKEKDLSDHAVAAN